MGHFPNLVGNASAFSVLSKYLDAHQYPNCILLRGPRGVGKFTAAKQFARIANCLGTLKLDCECPSCDRFRSHVSPHCHAYPNKVNKAVLRGLQTALKAYAPEGHRFVILRCEHLDPGVQDMFLKILEEPADDTSFLLTSAISLPKQPVVSRSVTVQFSPCSESELVDFVSRNPSVIKMFREFTDAECEILLAVAGGSPGSLFGLMADPVIRTKMNLVKSFFDRVCRPEFFRQMSGIEENSFSRMIRLLAMGKLTGSKLVNVTMSEAQWIVEELSKRSICPMKWRLSKIYMQLRSA